MTPPLHALLRGAIGDDAVMLGYDDQDDIAGIAALVNAKEETKG